MTFSQLKYVFYFTIQLTKPSLQLKPVKDPYIKQESINMVILTFDNRKETNKKKY